jgi:hypothetical protein
MPPKGDNASESSADPGDTSHCASTYQRDSGCSCNTPRPPEIAKEIGYQILEFSTKLVPWQANLSRQPSTDWHGRAVEGMPQLQA